MKTKTLLFPAALALTAAFFAAGCVSTPPPPRVSYPVTYNIQVGNTQVVTGDGGQNLNVNATQQVAVQPRVPLYYRLDSPVEVALTVFEISSSGARSQIGQMRGTSFTTSIRPVTSRLEFSFAVTQPNSGGTLKFTLSDRPIPAAIVP